ncbi:MAG: hypothetical protein IJ449_05685 [Clostridia bacterium]|nr:hypothetical protein [Clostridia bacterium]
MKFPLYRHLCVFCSVLLPLTVCTACAGSRTDGSYYAENRTFETFDVAAALGISFEQTLLDFSEPEEDESVSLPTADAENSVPNDTDHETSFLMRVYEKMELYAKVGDTTPTQTLSDGTPVVLTEIENSIWAEVESVDGKPLGYAKEGFLHAVDPDCTVYAELPIEYGMAKTNDETYVEAYSHLVDVRKYLKVYETTDPNSLSAVNLSDYDVVVCMQLSTEKTTIREPFYDRNLCMLQYDILPKLLDAIELFREDGYTVIIYDAYRPTSVQQRWFDVVRVHKWVADPSRGMGGVHDRGTAIDMSLIDKNGNLVEMPTPMHTFTEAAARSSTTMTDTARANMNYMKDVMESCGFDYINSEWWHFQDVNTKYYLPTDHPIDDIPLVIAEKE